MSSETIRKHALDKTRDLGRLTPIASVMAPLCVAIRALRTNLTCLGALECAKPKIMQFTHPFTNPDDQNKLRVNRHIIAVLSTEKGVRHVVRLKKISTLRMKQSQDISSYCEILLNFLQVAASAANNNHIV